MKKNKRIVPYIILIIIALVIVGIVFVLLNRNETQKRESSEPWQSEQAGEEAWDVKIIKGDIYKVYESTKNELLVSTTDIKDEVIESFIAVGLSPDKLKICFVGQSMVPQWLFYANIDGSGITKIGLGKNCVWSNNSQKVAYNNHTTDVSPVNVLVYDLALKKTINYTADVQSENLFRAYKVPVWSRDDSQITSEFSSLAMDGTGTTGKGVSVIDLKSGKISDE
ncbi:MAG TPA: hypothetical protein VMW42_05860 [Desulfatiglandales bacterium]|nr:hypothetical protein [Desulfatiglandales bacterium]